jgi:hypothetical protein
MNSTPLPAWIERELKAAPHHLHRRGLADLVTRLFGPISYRTIEGRPYIWRISNGHAVTETRLAIQAEYERFIAAGEYRTVQAKKSAAESADIDP